ncbi:MAG: endonuclease [Vicingaceae bacterium]
MKALITFIFFLPLIIKAQIIQADSAQLDFGVVLVGETDSMQVNLKNTSSDSLVVTNIKFYTIYNEIPFSAAQNTFTIPANGTYSLWVYFTPVQNILHNSEMVIQHNRFSGFTAIDLIGQGRFDLSYYDTTENMFEEDLKKALKYRLGLNYNSLSYSVARDSMYASIDNDGGDVECVYTGTTATFNTRSGANTNGFNCEHTFPQGFFSQNLPMRSDIHHLFPTTVTSNSNRGNNPFGTVTNGTATGGGSFYTNSTFEPRNEQKGRTARAMLYFVIRYQDYSSHFSTQETTLRTWHGTYPPDSAEKARNQQISTIQSNRNPFVDFPQLEERITDFVSNSAAPAIFGLDILQTSINFGVFLNQQADTFDYILVNRGNQDINFTNLSLSDTSILSFAGNSGQNSTLNPGEAKSIQVIVQTSISSSISETLSFNTNLPGSQASLSIPISGQSVITNLEDNRLQSNILVYPNPFNNKLTISGAKAEALNVRLFDALGKEKRIDLVTRNKETIILETSNLENGFYMLEVVSNNQRLTRKLIK